MPKSTEPAQAAPQEASSPSDDAPAVPSTEQLAQSPNWGQGGRYIINQAGDRVPAAEQE